MKHNYKKLIDACNEVILANEETIKRCTSCLSACGSDTVACEISEECVVASQNAQDLHHRLLHECNNVLDKKLYNTEKQRTALERCKKACHEANKETQNAISNISFYQTPQACALPLAACNESIEACDECIEAFQGIN